MTPNDLPKISFVMPARDAAQYISYAIDSLRAAPYSDWELVVVDDHSTDATYQIVSKISEEDSRVRVYKNTQKGKVSALNQGYARTCGEFIKCIDADDALDAVFFDHIELMDKYDAFCHDAYVTNNNMEVIGRYAVHQGVLEKTYAECLRYLVSLPRWSWSFHRSIAESIFPMPDELPFEDVWFALNIKKNAKKIAHLDKKLYYYRQHDHQVYGGILNFDKSIVIFRAKRILKLVDVLKGKSANQLREGISQETIFDDIVYFNELLAREQIGFVEILGSTLSLSLKIKVLLYKKFNRIAPFFVKLKWRLDQMKSALRPSLKV